MRRSLSLFVAVLLVSSAVAPIGSAVATPSAGTIGDPSAHVASSSSIEGPSTSTTASTIESATQRTDRGLVGSQFRTESADSTNGTCETTSNDEIGYWEGVCHDAELAIDDSDGLDDEELTLLVHRGMARVEYLRNRAFEEEVPVETMTREEYTETMSDSKSDPEFNRWNDQVWKALFIVGEERSSEEAIQGTLSGAVAGFYSPAGDRIVIVVPEGEEIRIDEATLVHELTHAMQDQYHNLSSPRYAGRTQDADLAIDGIVEGEASYVENRYDERCEDGDWRCLEEPETTSGGSGPPENWGVFITVFQPYSDGPAYVDEIIEEEGWDGVSRRMESPPNATAETIHRESHEPRSVPVADTAGNGWETYPNQSVNGSDTVGEASIFAMFWYQSRDYGADTFDWQHVLTDPSRIHPESVYNYAHESTDGWAGDRIVPYRNDRGEEERDGYVWVSEWETPQDATEFHATYLRMLDAHAAARRDDGTIYVATGGFQGTYGIERDGTRVTIVHAPTSSDVFDLRPAIDLEEPEPESTSESDPDSDTDSDPDRKTLMTPSLPDAGSIAETSEPTDPPGSVAEDIPGFTGIVALLAIVLSGLALATIARRRR
ncbi:Hvo_1808 family surface protein [Halopenitus sp. H-Gu1]|uniref:Hvo_1808 family surface protein n=1 Tax=Halopenitus sp. H-Gu1 TaxID=3242697 RepID=UPI00359CF227